MLASDPNSAVSKKPRRRWFQFSLASLFVLILLAAIPCAWVARRLEQKRCERAVVGRIDAFSAWAAISGILYQREDSTAVEFPGRKWLCRLFGDDFFSDVVGIDLDQVVRDEKGPLFHDVDDASRPDADNRLKSSDDFITSLARLASLRVLRLANVPLNDKELGQLTKLRRLTSLDISGTNVTDAALPHLGAFKRLVHLDLSDLDIGDAGLAGIEALTSLEELRLSNTLVGDGAMAHVGELKSLKQLDLLGTRVTNAGLAQLQGLGSLETLRLQETAISDLGLPQLAKLKSLGALSLEGTLVSDAGLVHLGRSAKLQSLCLARCPNVTSDGVAELSGHLPGCEISANVPLQLDWRTH